MYHEGAVSLISYPGEKHLLGRCLCGAPVLKVDNSALRTIFTDRTAYLNLRDLLGAAEGWTMFRCSECSEVVADVWQSDLVMDALPNPAPEEQSPDEIARAQDY